MVSSVPPEAPFVFVVAADEEGLLFPSSPEDALVVDSPEVVALSVLWDSLPAEDPPTPAPPPQLASTTTSTSVRAPTANVPSSALFVVLGCFAGRRPNSPSLASWWPLGSEPWSRATNHNRYKTSAHIYARSVLVGLSAHHKLIDVYTIAFMSLLQIVWRGPAKFVGPRQIGCSMLLTDSTRPSHSGLFCQVRRRSRQMDRIP